MNEQDRKRLEHLRYKVLMRVPVALGTTETRWILSKVEELEAVLTQTIKDCIEAGAELAKVKVQRDRLKEAVEKCGAIPIWTGTNLGDVANRIGSITNKALAELEKET